MRELHLFAGCGGGVLGSKLIGHTVIGYVEREPYRCRTLAQRIADGILDEAPIYCGTVREFINGGYAALYCGLVDVLCAGFPCPPFSLAGKRLGGDDPRNGWPETIDAIRVIKPRFCFLENVPGLITSPYLETICADLREAGYRIRGTIVSAFDVGSWQIRKRFWLLAYPPHDMADSNQTRLEKRIAQDTSGTRKDCGAVTFRSSDKEDLSKPNAIRCAGRSDNERKESAGRDGTQTTVVSISEGVGCGSGLREAGSEFNGAKPTDCFSNGERRWWDAEPGLDRMVDGVANRVDRIEAIGDGQVPRVVEVAWKTLTQGLL